MLTPGRRLPQARSNHSPVWPLEALLRQDDFRPTQTTPPGTNRGRDRPLTYASPDLESPIATISNARERFAIPHKRITRLCLANKSERQRPDKVTQPGLCQILRLTQISHFKLKLTDFQPGPVVESAPIAIQALGRAKSHLPIAMNVSIKLLPTMVAPHHELTVQVFIDVTRAFSVTTWVSTAN
jgi:hypothetical protein